VIDVIVGELMLTLTTTSGVAVLQLNVVEKLGLLGADKKNESTLKSTAPIQGRKGLEVDTL
jgi:hypothetical protein